MSAFSEPDKGVAAVCQVCLVMVALFMPLVPVFKALERGRHAGKGE